MLSPERVEAKTNRVLTQPPLQGTFSARGWPAAPRFLNSVFKGCQFSDVITLDVLHPLQRLMNGGHALLVAAAWRS